MAFCYCSLFNFLSRCQVFLKEKKNMLVGQCDTAGCIGSSLPTETLSQKVLKKLHIL